MCSFECGNFAKKLHISEKSSTFVANLLKLLTKQIIEMKKILSILAVGLLALGFVSCEKGERNKEFKITIDEISGSSAHVKVVAADTTQFYYWDVFESEDVAKYPEDSIIATINEGIEFMKAIAEAFEIEYTLDDLFERGESEYTYKGLNPETEYTVCLLKFDAEGKPFGPLVKKSFRTGQLEITGQATMTLSGVYFDELSEGYYELMAESADEKYFLFLSPDVSSMSDNLTMANFSDPDYLYFVVDDDELPIIGLNLEATFASNVLKLTGKIVDYNGIEYTTSITAEEGNLEDYEAPARKAKTRGMQRDFKARRVVHVRK